MSGIDQVLTRIEQIQARIGEIEGRNTATPAAASFAETLSCAQARQSGSSSLPPLPVSAPDASMIRPLPPLGQTGKAVTLSPAELDPLVKQSATKYGLDPSLLKAVIHTESSGDPNAVSRAGAMGLMQLMPSTVADSAISDPFDPAQNIDGGARKLSGLLGEFGGDLDKALAAYNAGAGAVKRYGGVPPYRETQDYVERIRRQLGAE